MNYVETMKTLIEMDDETLNKAMAKVKATQEQKARAMKEINDCKYAKEIMRKWFRT